MSLSGLYQARRDEIVDDVLGLSMIEKRFVELCWRNSLAAKRVAHLIRDYCEADTATDRATLRRLLLEDAVPRLRYAIEASSITVPDGYVLLDEQVVKALRSVVEIAAVVAANDGMDRNRAIFTMVQRLEVVANLDQRIGWPVDATA